MPNAPSRKRVHLRSNSTIGMSNCQALSEREHSSSNNFQFIHHSEMLKGVLSPDLAESTFGVTNCRPTSCLQTACCESEVIEGRIMMITRVGLLSRHFEKCECTLYIAIRNIARIFSGLCPVRRFNNPEIAEDSENPDLCGRQPPQRGFMSLAVSHSS